MILANLTGVIALVVMAAAAGVGIYAFVHAAMQRADAYPAVDKLTKPVWLLILGVGVLLVLLLDIFGAAICAAAAGVYLVDVKPKLLEIQGKSR
ncbi:DUF2516 family protein [[Mycobacterium] wendilense]|uniref:DUF2516 family protein n=2 Tax=[Mycobacterium] wendilense TaxID=3064284 RepID=A0ABN9P2P4_9MYCO|nr:DUF2516 family protein [Mycolicibacterium sp. MU0050]CAJ1585652.1 DUF2516 family protein [Mycolicibacterium sp. MU0050]